MPSVSRANTVPTPQLPPWIAVPYRVVPDELIINPPFGPLPSLLVELLIVGKLCSVLNPVPLVLTAKTVPWSEVPPPYVVPYRVLPDKINTIGPVPSLG